MATIRQLARKLGPFMMDLPYSENGLDGDQYGVYVRVSDTYDNGVTSLEVAVADDKFMEELVDFVAKKMFERMKEMHGLTKEQKAAIRAATPIKVKAVRR